MTGRIATSTKAENLFGAGKHGFRSSNPEEGVLPTQQSAEWCNGIQEGHCLIVEGNGGDIPPSGVELGSGYDDVVRAIIARINTIAATYANPTGQVANFFGSTAPAGWLIRNGLTIGDGSSGATGRANADCQALFTRIWNETDNTTDGGSFHIQTAAGATTARGVSAAADWAAHKRIPLPDDRGRVDRGLNTSVSGIDAGRVLAEAQADAFQTHNHKVYSTPTSGGTTSGTNHVPNPATDMLVYTDAFARTDPLTDVQAAEEIDGGSGVPRTAAETRMANRAYLPIIKL